MKINNEILSKESLKSQIQKFGDAYFKEDEIVVGILRYGAHIPHIYRDIYQEKSQSSRPIQLLLSHMLSYFPPAFYQGKRFLLLDDTVFSGCAMCNLKKILETEHSVPEENILTAALVLNEHSEFEPDYFSKRLSDAEYIAWKEVLGSLVTQDARPTDRDHPLYYFRIRQMKLGHFLDVLNNYGIVHTSSTTNSGIFKITLTIDAHVVKERINTELPSVVLGEIYKIRFYWKQEEDPNLVTLTMAPMGFPEINIDQFIANKDGQLLAKIVGLDENFFDDIYNTYPENHRPEMLFYFASRSIAALALEYFLIEVTTFCDLEFLDPTEVDEPIVYVFPEEYQRFYKTISGKINKILSEKKPKAYELNFFPTWKKLEEFNIPHQKDILIPISYEILGFLARDGDSAKWDGKRWVPNQSNDEQGVSFQELLDEYKDPIFISRALDELLDMGLLRAKDMEIRKGCFTRIFLGGGEYNAVQVSSIADTLNYEFDRKIDQKIIEEEALELWGPFL